MSSTRLSAEYTEDLMFQATKRRLITHLKQLLKNTRGKISLLIIITSKDRKQALKNQKTSIQRGRKLDLEGI